MTQDNRYIKFVQQEHKHYTTNNSLLPPLVVPRRRLGFFGWLGLLIIALSVVWFLK